MNITKVHIRILNDLIKYKVIAQSSNDENEVYFLQPDKSKIYLPRGLSFNYLRNNGLVEFIKEIGKYKYYIISKTGQMQATIANNMEALKAVRNER